MIITRRRGVLVVGIAAASVGVGVGIYFWWCHRKRSVKNIDVVEFLVGRGDQSSPTTPTPSIRDRNNDVGNGSNSNKSNNNNNYKNNSDGNSRSRIPSSAPSDSGDEGEWVMISRGGSPTHGAADAAAAASTSAPAPASAQGTRTETILLPLGDGQLESVIEVFEATAGEETGTANSEDTTSTRLVSGSGGGGNPFDMMSALARVLRRGQGRQVGDPAIIHPACVGYSSTGNNSASQSEAFNMASSNPVFVGRSWVARARASNEETELSGVGVGPREKRRRTYQRWSESESESESEPESEPDAGSAAVASALLPAPASL